MLESIRHNLKAWRRIEATGWRSLFTYRFQIALWGFASLFSTITGFIIVTVVYHVSSGLPGWSYFQLLALTSLANIAGGMLSYYAQIYSIVKKMRTGEIDALLTKPVNSVVYIITNMATRSAAASVVGGLVMLAYSLYNLRIGPLLLAYSAAAIALGMALTVMFAFAIAMLMYVLFKNGRFGYWLLTSLQQATAYPLQIYGAFGVTLFTVAVPFGIAVSYPAQLLLGKLPALPGVAVIAVEITMIALLYKFSGWVLANKYESGGG